jgi:hypothetical protein
MVQRGSIPRPLLTPGPGVLVDGVGDRDGDEHGAGDGDAGDHRERRDGEECERDDPECPRPRRTS